MAYKAHMIQITVSEFSKEELIQKILEYSKQGYVSTYFGPSVENVLVIRMERIEMISK